MEIFVMRLCFSRFGGTLFAIFKSTFFCESTLNITNISPSAYYIYNEFPEQW